MHNDSLMLLLTSVGLITDHSNVENFWKNGVAVLKQDLNGKLGGESWLHHSLLYLKSLHRAGVLIYPFT